VSDYATRIAARGMGRPAGALLAPRAVPRVLPGAPPAALDAAASSTRPLSTPGVQAVEQPPRVAEPSPSQAPPPDPLSPAPAESARERIVEREVTTALRVEAQQTAALQPSQPASAPAQTHEVRVATEHVRTLAERQPVVPAAPRVPGFPLRPERPGAAQSEPVAATPVELRLRPPAAPPVPASPAARAAALSQAPTVEVRIGRVEVRDPRPPDLPGWSTSAPQPAPAAPAEPAFARMAAARRYLDRGWG